jgi:hypothetical protein
LIFYSSRAGYDETPKLEVPDSPEQQQARRSETGKRAA